MTILIIWCTIGIKEVCVMKEKKHTKMAKLTASMLRKILVVEANSTSSALFHQPVAPKELAGFRKAR